MELDSCSLGVRAEHGESRASLPDVERMEQSKPSEEELERPSPRSFPEEEEEVAEATSGEEFCRLGSLRTGSASNAESTRMFVSLLDERSMAPYDASMQVRMLTRLVGVLGYYFSIRKSNRLRKK